MKTINYNQDTTKLQKIKSLTEEGIGYGLDLDDILKKINSVIETIESGKIRIVLMGTISDGKTSTIAGLLGKVKDNMKIDEDESTDELSVYHIDGPIVGYEIVDTPGLFGTKEKEIDGKNVASSDITIKYISEAHVILYVCNAVNPLKDSHLPIIQRTLRDFKKLNSTIFVINRMDETIYDLLDPESYAEGSRIKKNNLIERLQNGINLTSQEKEDLHIVCISASPKDKGMDYWLDRLDEYKHRSHIDLLQKEIDEVVAKGDVNVLNKNVIEASVVDFFNNITIVLNTTIKPLNKSVSEIEISCEELQTDLDSLKQDLSTQRISLYNRLEVYEKNISDSLKEATPENISSILEDHFGIENGKITMYKFERRLNEILNESGNFAGNMISDTSIKIEKVFDQQDKALQKALNKGKDFLGNVKVNNMQVLKVRDLCFKGFKFKPWGATKFAKNFNRAAGGFAIVIQVGLELWDYKKRKKRMEELENLRNELNYQIKQQFDQSFALCNSDTNYQANFAQGYHEMCKAIDERKERCKEMKKELSSLEAYKNKLPAELQFLSSESF